VIGEPVHVSIDFEKETTAMTSKAKQIKMIRKRKKKANKANLKADQKRIDNNNEVLVNLAREE
jgi:hypothetical protein